MGMDLFSRPEIGEKIENESIEMVFLSITTRYFTHTKKRIAIHSNFYIASLDLKGHGISWTSSRSHSGKI
jgi:hypothetical protein